ncbi:Cysteine sulfinate desulfinase/cysteine desulfurase or related enzyme [Halalkaliarchaeum sp. AArc-CO]|uniref:cysteine desulfurase family protein n=1 Tax=Halalkaliarchaeum sp. AArc-CO TaxID=2866381 RepID=UPI00217DBC1C|nr:cysteine desulfurase family protein [Halalkaliarchaeum sp. AArc-CO]UWG52192.1 Cysteine sulfinate desulfinase/cysteine desulfurase or related enzyme [Halalkaliarchaeum sp. AArc-CO]
MIYLDHAATTLPHEDVVAAMEPYLESHYHNPAAGYADRAAEGLETARERVATLIGAPPASIVFTGGGSEADNLALKGIVDTAAGENRGHVVTSAMEHDAIEETCRWLERRGVEVTRIAPREDGRVDPAAVEDAIRSDTVIVSIMHANNETGVVQPLQEIATVAHEHGALVHSDTVQSAGKLPVDVERLGLDMASLSAHRFYGPKGVGALYVRDGLEAELEPLIHGGGQEGGLRSGTENVPGLVGMGVAAERARADLEERADRLSGLRDDFVRRVREVSGGTLVGHPEQRLPGYALFCFEEATGAQLVDALADRGIAVSSGSACHTGTASPSRVLTEMGIDAQTALGAVRFSMGRHTTADDVDQAVAALEDALEVARG